MQRVLSVCAFILSAATLALVAFRPQASSPVDTAPPPAAASAMLGDDPDHLALRMAAMEDRIANLSRRVMELDRNARGVVPSSATTAPGQETQQDVAGELRQLRADLHAVATAEALSTDRGRELLKEAVRSVQGEVTADRFRELRERQDTAREERLQRLVRDARLTGSQERSVRSAMETEAAQRDALVERMRGGERNRETFTELRALRDGTDAQVRSLLSPEQYEQYTAIREEERRMWAGGGAGGGRRPDATSAAPGR